MKALNTKLLRLQFNDCFEVQPEVYRLSAVGLCLSTIHSRYYSFTKEYHFSDWIRLCACASGIIFSHQQIAQGYILPKSLYCWIRRGYQSPWTCRLWQTQRPIEDMRESRVVFHRREKLRFLEEKKQKKLKQWKWNFTVAMIAIYMTSFAASSTKSSRPWAKSPSKTFISKTIHPRTEL